MGQTTPIKRRKRLSKERQASRPTFEARMSLTAKEIEDKAWRLPPGLKRDEMLRKARQMSTASHIGEWLASPGLLAPE
jgi:hypothetical protein